jgi:hypothetical protein
METSLKSQPSDLLKVKSFGLKAQRIFILTSRAKNSNLFVNVRELFFISAIQAHFGILFLYISVTFGMDRYNLKTVMVYEN